PYAVHERMEGPFLGRLSEVRFTRQIGPLLVEGVPVGAPGNPLRVAARTECTGEQPPAIRQIGGHVHKAQTVVEEIRAFGDESVKIEVVDQLMLICTGAINAEEEASVF